MARLVQPGKQGGWVGGSLSWDKLGGYAYYSGPTATQVRLLRELVALYRTRVGSPGSYYPGGDERSIELSAFRLARPRRAVPEPLQEMALAGQRLVIPAARIGQTRNVIVYRLIARDTIEEKVMALKARKGELFASVIDEGNVFGGRLDADDIRGLLA
jgi:hypothetical protein